MHVQQVWNIISIGTLFFNLIKNKQIQKEKLNVASILTNVEKKHTMIQLLSH